MAKQFTIQYLVLPDFVFNNERLTFMSAKVYAFIHNYRMPEFFYGNERLAELFDCSIPTITRAISQLEKEGYITTKFDGRKRFIQDNYITHRVIKFDEAASSPLTTLPQAKDSSNLISPAQASTAEANKNNLIKKPMENFVNEEEFADKGWLERKRARSEKKRSGNSTKVGFGNKTRFPKGNDYQENAPKKGGVDYTDVV